MELGDCDTCLITTQQIHICAIVTVISFDFVSICLMWYLCSLHIASPNLIDIVHNTYNTFIILKE